MLLCCWTWPHENMYEQPASIEGPWAVSKTWRKRLACWRFNSSFLLQGEEITRDKMDIEVREGSPADKQHPRKLLSSHFEFNQESGDFFATFKCLLFCGLQKCWSTKGDGRVSYRTRGSAVKGKPRGTLWLQSEFPPAQFGSMQSHNQIKEMSKRQQMNKVSGLQLTRP